MSRLSNISSIAIVGEGGVTLGPMVRYYLLRKLRDSSNAKVKNIKVENFAVRIQHTKMTDYALSWLQRKNISPAMYAPQRVSRSVRDWDLIITLDSLIKKRLNREYDTGDLAITLLEIAGQNSETEDITFPFEDYDLFKEAGAQIEKAVDALVIKLEKAN